MIICKICSSNIKVSSKSLICEKCYNKQYFQKYYAKNTDKLKLAATIAYNLDHNKSLARSKKYREKVQFESKRIETIIKDNYTCSNCKSVFEEENLVVHHKDRLGRGSELKNNEDLNLITLCRACHLLEHHKEMREAYNKKYGGMWSYKYDKCIKCGTVDKKHHGNGLCVNCAARKSNLLKNPPKPVFEWSKLYPNCIECHTTKSPHNGKGLCRICSEKKRTEKRRIIRQNAKMGDNIV